MKVTVKISSLIFLISALNAQYASAEDPDLHTWKSIQYLDVPCPWANGSTTPSLVPTKEGLTLRLTFFRPGIGDAAKDFVELEPKTMSVRLHYTDGRIIKHNDPLPFEHLMGWAGDLRGGTASLNRVFLWGDNKFEEAWIELRFPDRVLWLEVPYGFTRDPSLKLSPSSEDGRPRIAPAMKHLDEGAKIVPWEQVEYDFGQIQYGWHLRLLHSNPYDANCELVLRNSADLFTPRTGVTVGNSSRTVLRGALISLRKEQDGRHDGFVFNRYLGNKELREWGKVAVKVDDKSYEMTMPSSLFRYRHGHADYESKDTLPSKSDD